MQSNTDTRYIALVLNDNDTYTGVDDCTLRMCVEGSDDDNNGTPSKDIIAYIQSPDPETIIIYMNKRDKPVNIKVVSYDS